MAEGDKLSIGTAQPMPKIFDINGEEIAQSDLKENDILLVYWAEPTKYKTETSVVRFGRSGENGLVGKDAIFFSRAESDPYAEIFSPIFGSSEIGCYYLKDIREIQFCAKSSSASSQTFTKLRELYKENRRLTVRLERIEKRLRDLTV